MAQKRSKGDGDFPGKRQCFRSEAEAETFPFFQTKEEMNYSAITEAAANASFCQNCADWKSYIDRRFNKLTEMIKVQNAAILKALGVPHTELKIETAQEVAPEEPPEVASDESTSRHSLASIISMFPLQSEEWLMRVDEQIAEHNEELFVDAVKSIVCNDLKKNFNSLLCKDLVLDCNLDGTHGKTRFREFKSFYNVLKQAIASDVDGPDPDGCIREAFQHAKKFYYKQTSMRRRKLNQTSFCDPLRF